MGLLTTDSATWIGSSLIDSDGARIGTIAEIYYDEQSGRPQWLFVKTARLGNRHSFVPLSDARRVAAGIMTSYDRSQIERAPKLGADEDLHDEETVELYRHYGLPHDALVDIEQPDGPTPGQRVLTYLKYV